MVMNKYLLSLVCLALLSGCGDDNALTDADIEAFEKVHDILSDKSISNKGFSGGNDELQVFVNAFTVCNEKAFKNDPNLERLTRLGIQEALYGFPLASLDNGTPEKTAEIANDNPALNVGVSSVFTALISPTTTQASVYKKDYSAFKAGSLTELVEYIEQAKEFNQSPLTKDNYSEKELKRLTTTKYLPIFCTNADVYLGLFDYSQVNDFDTISRGAALDMLTSTRQKAISEVTKKFKN